MISISRHRVEWTDPQQPTIVLAALGMIALLAYKRTRS